MDKYIKTAPEFQWTEATGDGVIYGYGVLDTQWLNFKHNHNETTPQNAFVTHWPKEYVEFYKGNPKDMKNVGENIGKALDPILDKAKELIKEIDAEKKAQEEAKKKKEEEAKAKTQTVHKNSSASKNSQVHASFVDAGLITGPLIIAGIGIAWELLKYCAAALGEKAKEDALLYYNPDGSITYITADYYSGSAARLNHVGWLGVFNNVDKVKEMSARIHQVTESKANAYSIFSKRKDFRSRITLKTKAPAKPKSTPKTPVKSAPVKKR